MKLKLVIASMSVLGLINSPAFASHSYKHHHKVKHQTVTQRDYKHDYKDMGSLPIKPVQCVISSDALVLVDRTQNTGRSLPNPCNPGWFNRIRVSGGINVDMGKWGPRNANIQGENYQRVALNDAYLNIGADISEWATAFASISYSNPTVTQNLSSSNGEAIEKDYSAQYSSTYNGFSTSTNSPTYLSLEQGFITIANFNETPFYLQLGKQFQDFSRYEIHPITRSMTQVMSEVLATSVKVGFIANGFNGSIYAFDNPIRRFAAPFAVINTNAYAGNRPTNYGAALGYDQPSNEMGWDIGVGVLRDMIGAIDVADAVNHYTALNGAHSPVWAAALYGDINTGPFTLGARYTQAMSTFNVLDLPRNGLGDIGEGLTVNPGASGARPWALGIQAGYAFNTWCDKSQNVYVGYQQSSQAGALLLPKHRYQAGYGMDVWKNTNVTAEWDLDNPYSAVNGGRGLGNTSLFTIRGSVKFG